MIEQHRSTKGFFHSFKLLDFELLKVVATLQMHRKGIKHYPT